jgi:hypothetical protein
MLVPPGRWRLAIAFAWGYAVVAALLLAAAGTEAALGVDAKGKLLESVAAPLSGAQG